MDERIQDRLFDLLLHHTLLLQKRKLRTMEMYNLTYLCFMIMEIVKNENVNATTRIVLERLMITFNELLYDYEIVQYFLTFYGIPQKVLLRLGKVLSNDLRRSNLLIDMFRLRVLLGAVNGNSDDIYFFQRGYQDLLRGLKNLAVYSPNSLNIVPAYYVLLNYTQTVIEFMKKGQSIKQINLKNISEEIVSTIKEYKKFLDTTLSENIQLRCFDMYVSEQMNLFLGSEFLIDYTIFVDLIRDQKYKNKFWLYHNLLKANIDVRMEFNRDIDILEMQKFNSYRDQIIYVTNYFKANPDVKFELSVEPFDQAYASYNRNWFRLDDYFMNYDAINSIKISERDILTVENMNDYELRQCVSKIITKIDKNIVRREANKPHGAYEISDMELPIFHAKNTIYLCMPFKTGIEIKDKVGVQHLYQISRPFIELGDKSITVFISAKDGTEIFHNEIKKMNALSFFRIETIMGETLVKLLKANSLI